MERIDVPMLAARGYGATRAAIAGAVLGGIAGLAYVRGNSGPSARLANPIESTLQVVESVTGVLLGAI